MFDKSAILTDSSWNPLYHSRKTGKQTSDSAKHHISICKDRAYQNKPLTMPHGVNTISSPVSKTSQLVKKHIVVL
eukprot:scaffold1390_cov138-Cylindrotheca_fusiformis.AAC.50